MPKYIDADEFMEIIRNHHYLLRDHILPSQDYGMWTIGIQQAVDETPAADVEPKRKWIPVTERLPEPKRKHYLCYMDDDSIEVCYWSNVSIRGNKWEWHNPNWKEVTHWMPLPEPPKEDSDAEVH